MGNGLRLRSGLTFKDWLGSILVVRLPVELIQIPQQHTSRCEQRFNRSPAVTDFTQDEPVKAVTRECLRQRPALRIAQSQAKTAVRSIVGKDELHAEPHRFTDDQGRSVEAELVGLRGPNVVLATQNVRGQWRLARLAAADQAYVRDWQRTPTAVRHVTVQAQVLALIARLVAERGLALMLITHDLGVIAEVCDRVLVMYAGRVVEQASARQLFDHAQHPYTRGLLAALPDLAAPQRRLEAIAGSVPEPGRLPTGCSFRPRCGLAEARCAAAVPPMIEVRPGHHVACLQRVGR